MDKAYDELAEMEELHSWWSEEVINKVTGFEKMVIDKLKKKKKNKEKIDRYNALWEKHDGNIGLMKLKRLKAQVKESFTSALTK